MKKLTRNLALVVVLTTACGAFAHGEDIPTGTDPVPPSHQSSSGSAATTTIATILGMFYTLVL